MRVFITSPAGIVTHLPLDQIIWRLELAVVGRQIGVGFRYLTSGSLGTALGFLAAVDVVNDKALNLPDVLQTIARKGLPKKARAQNIELLQESLKILSNVDGFRQAQIDEYILRGGKLVDVYHDVLAVIGPNGTGSAKGSFEDWSWEAVR